jgi:integrase
MALIPKVADARELARASMLKARQGIDPRAQRRQVEDQAKATAAADSLSFGKLAEVYLTEYVERNCKASTATEERRQLGIAAAFFGEGKPAHTITEADVVDLISQPPARGGKNGGLSSKNSLLASVKRCFKFAKKTTNPATRKRYIETDPAAEVEKPLKKEPSRERVLADHEIVAFWKGCDTIGWPFGPCFQLLLVTGQRREEVAGMRWHELDLAGRVWNIPSARTKNSRPHIVHLSDLAMSIIQGLPRFKPIAGRGFVFSTKGDVSISGFSYAKDRIVMPAEDWTLHDLRRTITTGMASLGVAPHVADRVLNHISGQITGVAAIYNRFAYLEERKGALEVWGRFLTGLVRPEAARRNDVALAG